MTDKKKEVLNIVLNLFLLVSMFCLGALMTLEIDTGIKNFDNEQHIYDTETEIVYVDKEVMVYVPVLEVVEVEKEVIVIETEIEYVNVYLNEEDPGVPRPIATHLYYVDWFEEYEELLDDFVDEMYNLWDDSSDIVFDLESYLETKLDNGETLDASEVEFLLMIQEYDFGLYFWDEYVNSIQEEYFELMDRFPEEVE